MSGLRSAWRRLLGTLAGGRSDARLSEEIESHIEMQTEDNRRAGMSAGEARRAAVLKFGAVEAVKETYRDRRGIPVIAAFAQDVRYALRALRREPGFAAAAILSLALGVGAATAVFTVADTVLFQKLPYAEASRLATVSIWGAMSGPWFETLRSEARSLEDAALFAPWYFNLAGDGEPERIPAARVSAGLFPLLGIRPQLGRVFLLEEDRDGAEKVVLLGHGVWSRRFGRDPSILGRKITLNGAPHTVVGVMPPGFRFPEGPEHHSTVGPFPPAEMWRPMALEGWERTCRSCYNFGMIARLRAGTGASGAAEEVRSIASRYGASANAGGSVQVLSIGDAVTSRARMPLLVLTGAVLLALFIACMNVANLLLARGVRRQSEMAIRLSLGATRSRLIAAGLTEAATLSFLAGVLGVAIAAVAVRALVVLAPADMPRLAGVAVNWRLLFFASALTLATAVLFGTAPAVIAARRGRSLQVKGRGSTAGPSRLRAALVIGELVVAVVLLVGSGLLAKSFVKMTETPLGFRTESTITVRLSLSETRYDAERAARLVRELAAGCEALPGVLSAAATSTLPLTGEAEGWGVEAEGAPDRFVQARVRAVTPAYFATLGIPLLSGRGFDTHDPNRGRVAIVSKELARQLWPGIEDPTGRRLARKPPVTVVGVVADTRASGIDAEIRPYLYVPFGQFTPPEFALAVRTAGPPEQLVNAIKAVVWKLDKDQPVTNAATMEEIVSAAIAPRRFPAALMSFFAGFALLLTATGIYGVLSYSVAQRTQEIGIRMALGASRGSVIAGVLRQAALLGIVGTSAGLLLAMRSSRMLAGLLYGVAADDVPVFAACAAVLAGVAIVASAIPAWRAARLDPVRCLRYE